MSFEQVIQLLQNIDKKLDILINHNNTNNNIINKIISIREKDNYHTYAESNYIKKCLEGKGHTADFKLFKNIHLQSGYEYPIKIINRKILSYYNGVEWIDNDIIDVCKIILNNIQNAYMKENVFENSSKNPQKFIENQKHILAINDVKYIKKFSTLLYKFFKN